MTLIPVPVGDKWSEPANTLAKRISDFFEPGHVVRMAKAEAKAAQIKAEGEGNAELIKAEFDDRLAELRQRAFDRLTAEEVRKQQNIDQIVAKALPAVTDQAKPENIDEDWMANFFDKCRLVSNEEMQFLWAKLLAGEANRPGTFSNRLVNLFQSLRQHDAYEFRSLCRFYVECEFFSEVVVFEPGALVYIRNGVRYESLMNLQSLGLISVSQFQITLPMKPVVVRYDNQPIGLMPAEGAHLNNNLAITQYEYVMGTALLTPLGKQLRTICDFEPVEGFADYLVEQWGKRGYISKRLSGEEYDSWRTSVTTPNR